ncbi:hypothetical protein SUDANB120_01455 [Streptomyces sp. enrichment culture]
MHVSANDPGALRMRADGQETQIAGGVRADRTPPATCAVPPPREGRDGRSGPAFRQAPGVPASGMEAATSLPAAAALSRASRRRSSRGCWPMEPTGAA